MDWREKPNPPAPHLTSTTFKATAAEQAELPGPPSLSFPWEMSQHKCLSSLLQAPPGMLHSVWGNPKDLLYQTRSTCPHPLPCPDVGSPRLSTANPTFQQLGLTSAVLQPSPAAFKLHYKGMSLKNRFHIS